MTDDWLSIGAMAERTGVAVSALRFYEREGLIVSQRTDGNQRRYHRSELRRVAFIRVAQRVGLSLEEIRDALATLPDERVARPRATGLGSPGRGARVSTSRSPCSNASATS